MTETPVARDQNAEAAPQGAAPAAARSSHTRPRRPRRPLAARAAFILLAALAGAAACGGSSGSGDGGSSSLDVFAASSLTEAFTELADDYAAARPDTEVTLNFAGSNDLVTQMRQGASADVFASADETNMEKAGELVDAPQVFAGNTLAIAVAPGNPEHIDSLGDLGRPDLKVVLAAPEVPAGKYAREILDRAGVDVSPVSLEVTVKGVVTKVSLGEADAGIVYVTDVTAAKGEVGSVAIPEAQNVVASYPIATVAGSDDATAAQAFVDLVLSDRGREVLAERGFLPPPSE